METIKERAQSYTDKVGILGAYQGYIAGATEQRKIDVEKACGILWGMCLTRRHEFKTYKDVITTFRKAMEE